MVLKNTVKMSQDIVADALNLIMNSLRKRTNLVSAKHYSKFLLSVLAIGKLHNYINDYHIEGKLLHIEFGDKLNACRAVKPHYLVRSDEIMKYVRRYLPSRNMGILVISTSKGLMTHHTALEQNIGGSIIAYFY